MTLQINVAHLRERMNRREAAPFVHDWLLNQLPEYYWSTKRSFEGLGKPGAFSITLHVAAEIMCGDEGLVELQPGDEVTIFCDPRFRGTSRQIAAIFCKEGTGRNVFQLSVYPHRVVRKGSDEKDGRKGLRRMAPRGAMRL